MRRIIWVNICTVAMLCAADIEALRQYKQAHKSNRQAKHIEAQSAKTRLVMIVFKESKQEATAIALQYAISLQQCIASKACLFRIPKDQNIDKRTQQIKKEHSSIKSIQKYKKYHFKRL